MFTFDGKKLRHGDWSVAAEEINAGRSDFREFAVAKPRIPWQGESDIQFAPFCGRALWRMRPNAKSPWQYWISGETASKDEVLSRFPVYGDAWVDAEPWGAQKVRILLQGVKDVRGDGVILELRCAIRKSDQFRIVDLPGDFYLEAGSEIISINDERTIEAFRRLAKELNDD